MAVEPSEDAINQVVGIASILPDQAAKLLKVSETSSERSWVFKLSPCFQMNNGDAQQAINAYFENPGVLVRVTA